MRLKMTKNNLKVVKSTKDQAMDIKEKNKYIANENKMCTFIVMIRQSKKLKKRGKK